MRQIVKEDILKVLTDLVKALKSNDYPTIAELSNHTIHDASIFQEDDPLTLAVLVYALSKIIQRYCEQGKVCPNVAPYLQQAYDALKADDDNGYRAVIKNVLRKVGELDAQLNLYIQEVIEKSKIKKASKLHEHGISIARTAELLGLSQWELQGYIGKTITEIPHDGMPVLERLRRARELFS
ncbi:MAG TPA: hypothetical protein VI612_03115 [Candidatus Nanoarchaeia archaeon]|nr:hypothetical protein [Candidatus Nanoarchaeia archaeon]